MKSEVQPKKSERDSKASPFIGGDIFCLAAAPARRNKAVENAASRAASITEPTAVTITFLQKRPVLRFYGIVTSVISVEVRGFTWRGECFGKRKSALKNQRAFL